MSCPRLCGQIVFDILCFVAVSLPTPLLMVCVSPFHRGFFCDDQTIRYPFRRDTVTALALFSGCFIFPICLMIVVEAVCFVWLKLSANRNASLRYPMTKTCSVPIWLVTFYKVFGFFMSGMAVSQSLTFIGKYSIGRLRPHFIDVCQPDLDRDNCTSNVYIDGNVCTRQLDFLMIDARQSFPSGHASISVYTAVFLMFYLESRLTWKFSKLLKPCLQALLIFAALFVAMSRVMDNKHHWSDVVAGSVIGIVIGTMAGIYTMRLFTNRRSREHLQLPYRDVATMEEPSRTTKV